MRNFLCASLAVFAALSCAPRQPATQAAAATESEVRSVTVVDMTGRAVAVPRPVTRVVALTAADCEIIYALGMGATLVGRGAYCDWPPEILAVPALESGANTNCERIIALAPDLVFLSGMAQSPQQLAQLEAAGLPVIVSDAVSIAGAYASIAVAGEALDREAEAAALIAEMRAAFDELSQAARREAAARGGGRRSIYFEVSPIEYGLWTAGSGTFMDEAAALLELDNIFSDIPGWQTVSEEQVIARNPDYILTAGMNLDGALPPVEAIRSRPAWKNITAVKNGAIYRLSDDRLSRPGPRLVSGVQALYDFVYGPAK